MTRRLLLINPANRVSLYGDYAWPPLSLAYVSAAARHEGWEVELVDEQHEGEVSYHAHDADLVGITAFTTQATRAYAIAAQFRARGVAVVMGGIHVSLVSNEAREHVDAIVTGEGEGVVVELLRDFVNGTLREVYAGGTALALWPDRTIFEKYDYRYASAQTTRGCPMDCSFCSVTAFNGRAFRMRDVDDVVAELGTIGRREVLLVDDDLNGFSLAAKNRCAALFRAMIDAGNPPSWITQVTINFGDGDELPALARAAGCAGVFIGLESTDTKSLALIRKDGRSQKRGVAYYRENLARIRSHGIGVVGSFILGLDTQNMDTIADEILGFADDVELDGLNPTILTPLPGTRDYERMAREGRLLFTNYPSDWERYTLAFPVHEIPNASGARVMMRYFDLLQWFRPDRITERFARTHRTVSADAAWHAYQWNRTWSNYASERGIFRRTGNSYNRLPFDPPRLEAIA